MKGLQIGITTTLILCFFATAISLQFNYQDQTNWGGNCAEGQLQSPINIISNKIQYCPYWGYQKITFMCEDFTEVIDDSHDDYTISDIGNAYIFYYSDIYNRYQGHEATSLKWHTKSEHTINGEYADAELEIIFEARPWNELPPEAKGPYADTDISGAFSDQGIIGISMRFLFKVQQNAQLDIFSGSRTDGSGNTIWNLNTMLGCALDRYFYAYPGTTTVPTEAEECADTVWTYVSKDILPLTQASLNSINEKINYEDNTNYREIQPLNGRDVYLTGRPCQAEAQ